MKKILLLLCFCLLCGCQSQSSSQYTTSTSQQKEDLTFKPWHSIVQNGDGNENGYYHIKLSENDEGSQFNICYYDYASKKEVILCNKPECQHKDETCTSYLMYGFGNQIFVYNDSIFIIDSRGMEINSLGQRQETGTKIMKRNLDGSEPKEVYSLKQGYELNVANFVITDDILYIETNKKKDYKMNNNSRSQVDTERKLCAINLKTGESKDVYDLMDKNIIGVDGRNIVLIHYIHKEDPMKYLEKRNFSKYDELIKNRSTGYSTFNIDTLKDNEIIKADLEASSYYKGNVYSSEKDAIYSVNIANGEKKKLISYNKNLAYFLSGIYDGYILLDEHKNDDNFTLVSSYIISLEDPKMQKLSFATRAPKQPIKILSETKDSFLVKYDREGHSEKSWAGTNQYEETKQYIGLIKKTDYFQNKANYENIELLK